MILCCISFSYYFSNLPHKIRYFTFSVMTILHNKENKMSAMTNNNKDYAIMYNTVLNPIYKLIS